MNYVTSIEKAKEWGVSQRRVAILCQEGRIKGAELIGNRWLIPKTAKKPVDPRKNRTKNNKNYDVSMKGGV